MTVKMWQTNMMGHCGQALLAPLQLFVGLVSSCNDINDILSTLYTNINSNFRH